MGASQFAKSECDRPINESCEQEAQDDCGSREPDGWRRTKKEACANGSADSNHGHLAGTQLMAKSLLVCDFLL